MALLFWVAWEMWPCWRSTALEVGFESHFWLFPLLGAWHSRCELSEHPAPATMSAIYCHAVPIIMDSSPSGIVSQNKLFQKLSWPRCFITVEVSMTWAWASKHIITDIRYLYLFKKNPPCHFPIGSLEIINNNSSGHLNAKPPQVSEELFWSFILPASRVTWLSATFWLVFWTSFQLPPPCCSCPSKLCGLLWNIPINFLKIACFW